MGEEEKNYFAVQLMVIKDKTKLKPFSIFKDMSFNRERDYRRRTVTCELFNCLDDDLKNFCPPIEKCI